MEEDREDQDKTFECCSVTRQGGVNDTSPLKKEMRSF